MTRALPRPSLLSTWTAIGWTPLALTRVLSSAPFPLRVARPPKIATVRELALRTVEPLNISRADVAVFSVIALPAPPASTFAPAASWRSPFALT